MNETNPIDTLKLASVVLASLANHAGSPHEKVAALRTAAAAIEEAEKAQQMAVIVAGIVRKTIGGAP